MSRLKQLISEVHHRSLWQVLLIYIGGALVGYQAIQALTEGLSLPQWFPALAVLLFIVGLPIVLATSFVQEGFSSAGRDPTLLPDSGIRVAPEVSGARRLFTWRNAILGGAIAFGLWGIGVTGWLMIGDKSGRGIGEASVDRKSVAVLPLENLSPDPDNEFFTAGIHEEIIAQLSKISELKVISRTSVMEYKDQPKNLRDIAGELDVTNILEGSVRRAGERVRITVQLIDAASDDHLWTENYERDLTDVFAIQSDVAQQIAAALKATLTPAERERIEARPTDNLDAYDYYLRGKEYFLHLQQEEYNRSAVQMFERAVELDPNFTLAYANLTATNCTMFWFRFDASEERLAKAKRAVDKAIELEPGLPEVHAARGWYHYHCQLDYDSALEHFAIAQSSQPNDANVLTGIGYIRRRQGKLEQAAASIAKALELDPRQPELLAEHGRTYLLLRHYAQAERYFDRAIALSPESPRPYAWKAQLYLNWEGSIEKARAALSQNPSGSDDPFIAFASFSVDVFDGRYDEALQQLASQPADSLETQYYFITRAQLQARAYRLLDQPGVAQAHYDTARAILETHAQLEPRDARYRGSLGIAYAGLGRKEDAIREGELAVELLPVSVDAWRGSFRVEELARIYVMVGEYDAAIDQLELLLSIPSELSVQLVRINPLYDPLRSHPRFQALLEKYQQPQQ